MTQAEYDSWLLKVSENGMEIANVPEQTEELCIAAVKKNPWALRLVKEQTEEICLTAVGSFGLVLSLVKEKTPAVIKAAIKQNGMSLQHVPEELRTEEICFEAIRNHPDAIRFVQDPAPELSTRCLAP